MSKTGEMQLKILICDDEEVLRRLVRASLARGNYELIDACDGHEALVLAQAHRPDLIVLDMMMPLRNGLDVLRLIRADDELAETPVILLSARTQREDRDAADDAGATAYLAKPFSPTDLAFLVARLVAPAAPPPTVPAAATT